MPQFGSQSFENDLLNSSYSMHLYHPHKFSKKTDVDDKDENKRNCLLIRLQKKLLIGIMKYASFKLQSFGSKCLFFFRS